MIECRPATTPMDAGFQIGCDNDHCTKIDAKKYQSLVGSLMYLAISVRRDISVYLKRIMNKIGINDYESKITLHGDNLSAQKLANYAYYMY